MPPRPQTTEGIFSTDALASVTACSVVPPHVALGVVGVLLTALYVAHSGCGSWRAGGQLRASGGVMIGRQCGGLCSCGRHGGSGVGIVRAEGGCCGG